MGGPTGALGMRQSRFVRRSGASVVRRRQNVEMTDAASLDNVGIFLETATVVYEAIADEAVVVAWDRPSVLEEQQVSNLCGHLARGTWVVGEYLAAGPPA